MCTDICVQTNENGDFSLPNNTGATKVHSDIIDPNKGLSSQMNFITMWKDFEVITAWEWNGISFPEQTLNYRDVFPIEKGVLLSANITNLIGLMKTNLALCPIDLSTPGVWITTPPADHIGVDIACPYGVPHFSPGNCRVDELYISSDGGNGILMICADIAVAKVSLHHVDFRYNNYETLAWYGIPVDTFFNSDGTPIYGVLGVQPTNHNSFVIGENIHLYMGTTGENSARIHTHMSTWIYENEILVEDYPGKYVGCSK